MKELRRRAGWPGSGGSVESVEIVETAETAESVETVESASSGLPVRPASVTLRTFALALDRLTRRFRPG